jgi:hypothetical protein
MRHGIAATVVLTAAWLGLQSQPTAAQYPRPQGPTGIVIEYKEPTNPAHRPIYERLKKRKVLEQYKDFMAPLKLDKLLAVRLQGCDGIENAWYSGSTYSITYCYEMVTHYERIISESDLLPGFRKEDALVAGFVETLLHETGHAIFHILDLPIFGREEDAADAIASFVMLRVGKNSARRLLAGAAFAYRAGEQARERKRGGPRTLKEYADIHGTDAQRFFNSLCIALGSDEVEGTKIFSDFEQLLPEFRQETCAHEYMAVRKSFLRLVLPHVDQELMKKVQETEWLRSEDGTDILPPKK